MKFIFLNTGIKQENGGIVRSLGLGEELIKKGHEVVIIITNEKENVQAYGSSYKGIKFDYIYTKIGFRQLSRLYHLCIQKNVDIVHCMSVDLSILLPALICKKIFLKKYKLVVDFEDKQSLFVRSNMIKRYQKLESLAVKYADKIICASKELADEYSSLCNHTCYLPFAINYNEKCFNDKKNKNNEVLEIGYLGSINEGYKEQIDFLIDAAVYLKHKIKYFKINIGGTGKLINYFLKKVKDYEVDKEIIFHGFIKDDELNEFFSKMDILTLNLPDNLMNRYRCPNKIFIYCGTGLPIVSNNVGEVGRILSNYPNAVFYKTNDFKSFADAVKTAKNLNNKIPMNFYAQNSWEKRADDYLKYVISN